jgi:hypothetical protein
MNLKMQLPLSKKIYIYKKIPNSKVAWCSWTHRRLPPGTVGGSVPAVRGIFFMFVSVINAGVILLVQ